MSLTWLVELEFTPLEFETHHKTLLCSRFSTLEFTPLEFETHIELMMK